MKRFIIERDLQGAGALSSDKLRAISQKSCAVLAELGSEVQWQHSYVTADRIYCVYLTAIALPQRILLRHLTWGLPSGQAVAHAMGSEALTSTDLADIAAVYGPFATATPLWYYILAEAKTAAGGLNLGPVGGRIVAGTLIGLLRADPTSHCNVYPHFQPFLGADLTLGPRPQPQHHRQPHLRQSRLPPLRRRTDTWHLPIMPPVHAAEGRWRPRNCRRVAATMPKQSASSGRRNVSATIFLAVAPRSSTPGPSPRPRSHPAIRSRPAQCRGLLHEAAALSGVRVGAADMERQAAVV